MEMQRVGQVSWSGYTRPSYLFNEVAITLQHWCERAEDGDECGVRVEVQRLDQSESPGAKTEFAARVLHIAGPIWRGDLFTLSTGKAGNFDRAHFHPHFIGVEPCDRHWDAWLTQDPFAWLRGQLEQVDTLFAEAGFAEMAAGDDVARIRALAPRIEATARQMMDEVERLSPDFSLPET